MKNEHVGPPDYVSADAKEREEFLSQRGNFSPGERGIFHFLCGVWQPEIPYGRASSGANLGLGNKKAEFQSLMAKLRKARIGLLRTRLDGGVRTEDVVVLTDEGDFRFYANLLSEESARLDDELPGMPALERLLTSRGVEIPDRHVRDFTFDELVAAVDGRMARPAAILRLPAIADQPILVSPDDVADLFSRTRAAVRTLLGEGDLLAYIAKACDTTATKLKSVLGSNNATAWAGFTKCLFDRRTDLEARDDLSISKALYPAAAVAHRMAVAQASADRERVKKEKERLQDLEVIAAEVQKHPRRGIPQVELNRILDGYQSKYGVEFDDFREEFFKRFVTPKERRNLSTIQILGKTYIHRDNIYRVFLDRFQDGQAQLYTHYLAAMGEFVRSRHGGVGDVFASYEAFCTDIKKTLPEVDAVLAELFGRPFLLAEVIIYGEKKRKNVSSIEDVRPILARFFVSDRMDLRDYATIFELRLVELFETAFIQLPLLLQIWQKITGKYDSLRETLLRRSGSRSSSFRDASGGSDSQRVNGTHHETREVGHRRRNGTVRASTGSHRTRTKPDTKKVRYYTKRDQERAWDEFSQALKQ